MVIVLIQRSGLNTLKAAPFSSWMTDGGKTMKCLITLDTSGFYSPPYFVLFSIIQPCMLLRRLNSPRFRIRTMSTVTEFVAAATRADPKLEGLNDTDKAAIKKLQAETERLSQDLSVGRLLLYSTLTEL